MKNSEQAENLQSRVPSYGIEKYLEKASNFYYKENNPEEEAGFLLLLQDINNQKSMGVDWREDRYLAGRIESFIKKRFENLIAKRQGEGDEQGVLYFRERLKILLEDIHRKG